MKLIVQNASGTQALTNKKEGGTRYLAQPKTEASDTQKKGVISVECEAQKNNKRKVYKMTLSLSCLVTLTKGCRWGGDLKGFGQGC